MGYAGYHKGSEPPADHVGKEGAAIDLPWLQKSKVWCRVALRITAQPSKRGRCVRTYTRSCELSDVLGVSWGTPGDQTVWSKWLCSESSFALAVLWNIDSSLSVKCRRCEPNPRPDWTKIAGVYLQYRLTQAAQCTSQAKFMHNVNCSCFKIQANPQIFWSLSKSRYGISTNYYINGFSKSQLHIFGKILTTNWLFRYHTLFRILLTACIKN